MHLHASYMYLINGYLECDAEGSPESVGLCEEDAGTRVDGAVHVQHLRGKHNTYITEKHNSLATSRQTLKPVESSFRAPRSGLAQ